MKTKQKANFVLPILAEYFGTYLPITRGVSHNTIKSYQFAFLLLFEFIYEQKNLAAEKVTFDDLCGGMIIDYLNWIEDVRGCSTKTRNLRRAAIKSFAKFAARNAFTQSLMFASEVADIPRKKVPDEDKIRYFTKDEVTIMLNLPDTSRKIGQRDAVLMSVLYSSGARVQEICNLTVNDISFGQTTSLRLLGKHQKARLVTIPQKCAVLLRDYLKSRGLSESNPMHRQRYVFSSQTNENMSISGVWEIVKKYVEQAKAKHSNLFRQESYSPHSFRHSIAVHMLECGESLAVIRTFLGHASITSTLVYASVTPGLANKYLERRSMGVDVPDLSSKSKENFPSLWFLNNLTVSRNKKT